MTLHPQMHLGYLRLREMITEFQERSRTPNPAPMGAPKDFQNGHASAAPAGNGAAVKSERERDFDKERERRDRERRESREHRGAVPLPEDPRASKHREDERKRSRSPINICQ